jgi:hypothetical protein
MSIGIRMRTLWRLKVGVVVSLALALLAATWSVEKISLSPFALTPRSLEMATATTHVLIDTQTSQLIDLRQDTYAVDGLKNRAVLLGNVVASSAVQAKIAARAGVPVERLRIQAPLTTSQPAPPVDSENTRHTTDILKSTDQYRVNIKVNPTVPMIDIYSQTPTAESAAALGNAAAGEMKDYMAEVTAQQDIPLEDQVRATQLGRAHGVIINHGVKWQTAFIVFALTLGICCASVIFLGRVWAGWRQAAFAERVAEA